MSSQTELKQQIIQGFVRGDLFEMPAGDLSVVLGAESRRFKYDFFYNGTPGGYHSGNDIATGIESSNPSSSLGVRCTNVISSASTTSPSNTCTCTG